MHVHLGELSPRTEQLNQSSGAPSLAFFCSRVTSFMKTTLTYYLNMNPAIIFTLVCLGSILKSNHIHKVPSATYGNTFTDFKVLGFRGHYSVCCPTHPTTCCNSRCPSYPISPFPQKRNQASGRMCRMQSLLLAFLVVKQSCRRGGGTGQRVQEEWEMEGLSCSGEEDRMSEVVLLGHARSTC